MASCIIKSVLSKKMQVEQNNSKSSRLQKKAAGFPAPPQPADQQRGREGGGGKTGGGVFKAPVHVVRDMRSLVKNTYSLSFSTATHDNNKPARLKVIGQEVSPPPTYQQALGVKGHNETKRSCQASLYSSSGGGHVPKVNASLSQSQDRKQSNIFSRPITKQRRGSEPTISRRKMDDVTRPVMLLDPPTNSPLSSDLSELNQSERARGVSHQAGTSLLPAPPSTSRHPQGTQPLLPAQEQSSILGVSSQFAPGSSQQLLQPCFYTPTLHPHLGKVSYLHSHLSYIHTPSTSAPTFHLLRRSEENQSRSTGNPSVQPDIIKTCPPHRTRTAGDQESDGNTVTPAPQEQHEQQKPQQPPFLCNFQGYLPSQVGSDIVDLTGSVAVRFSGTAPFQVRLDPKSGRCFYVDTPPQPQRKMLLDPETGQYIQVFLPVASSSSNTCMFPVHYANPAPTLISPAPTVMSVMQFQPMVAASSMYAPPCLPFTLHTPSVNHTHTAP